MPTRTWRGNTYRFTVTSATATAGDTYTNNGQTFTVTDTIAAGTILYCFGTGAPTSSGNLVRTSGSGTNPIIFSAVTSPNTNWGTATNWLENAVPTALSNGPNGPSTGDDVVFNANSRDCVVNIGSTCLTLNFTGYVNTFTISNGITLSFLGNSVILGSGMTFTSTTGILSDNPSAAPSGSVGVSGNYTINFNGITIPNLTIGSSAFNGPATRTFTVVGTTPTVRNLVVNNGYSNYSVNLSGILNVTTSLTMVTGGSLGSAINLVGNVGVSGSARIGNITIPSGSTLTMNSSIVVGSIAFTGTGALVHNNNTCSFNGAGTGNTSIVEFWNVVTRTSSYTWTSNLNVGNDYTDQTSDFVSSGGAQIRIKGSGQFNVGGFSYSNFTGFSGFRFIGTGTISMENNPYYSINISILIDTTNPLGYVIGTTSRLNFNTSGASLTLVGNTSTASFFSTTSMVLNGTWTFDVNRTGTGGSEITLPNLNVLSSTMTFTNNTKCNNFDNTSGVINGDKLLVLGNATSTSIIQGTGTIEMSGSVNRTISIPDLRVNLITNKSGGATITSLVNLTINASKTLSLNTTTLFGTTLVTFSANAITFNNSSGSSLYDITFNGNIQTINNLLNVSRNLTIAGTTTFTGPSGWTCANLLCSTAGSTITLQNSITYRTTTSVNMLATNALRILMISNSGSIRAIWTLDQGASQSIAYVDGTRINSSQGQTIWSFGSTLTDTLNWNVGSQLPNYGFIAFS
jgi:hypothetical protein